MFVLADPNTIRLLRALSLDGPATERELTARLAVSQAVVRHAICQGLAIGVVRSLSTSAERYEVVPAAIAAAVIRHRDALLGATA